MGLDVISLAKAGILGGIIVPASLLVIELLLRAIYAFILRNPYYLGNALGALILFAWLFLLVPVLLAIIGALAVKWSLRSIRSTKDSIITSLIAGIIATVVGTVLFYSLDAFFPWWNPPNISFTLSMTYFINRLINTFTSPKIVFGLFILSLFSAVGGLIYYNQMARKQMKQANEG